MSVQEKAELVDKAKFEREALNAAYLEYMKYPVEYEVDTQVVDMVYNELFGSYLSKKKELKDLYRIWSLNLEAAHIATPETEVKKKKKAPTSFSE